MCASRVGPASPGPPPRWATARVYTCRKRAHLEGKRLNLDSGSYLYAAGTNNTLTLDNTTTASGTVSIYTDGSTGTAFTNQGTINQTGGTGQIYSLSLTNTGTISATAG